MSKKRLEEIKTWLNRGFDLTEEDIEWLIEQAGRVQELEEDLTKYRNGLEFQLLINNSIKKQNKRYREAIERALGESGWGDEGNALYRTIGILTKALEGDDD